MDKETAKGKATQVKGKMEQIAGKAEEIYGKARSRVKKELNTRHESSN